MFHCIILCKKIYYQIQCKLVPNSTKKMHNLHHYRKLMQIRCQKGADTEMPKCLVGLEPHGIMNYSRKLMVNFKKRFLIQKIVQSK